MNVNDGIRSQISLLKEWNLIEGFKVEKPEELDAFLKNGLKNKEEKSIEI